MLPTVTAHVVLLVALSVCAIGAALAIGGMVMHIVINRKLRARGLQAPLTKFRERDPFARTDDIDRFKDVEEDEYTRTAPHLPGDHARPGYAGFAR